MLFHRELRKGDQGEDVKFLQRLLFGVHAAVPGMAADGVFGDYTHHALVRAQEALKLPVTGAFDKATRAVFKSIYSFDFDAVPE